MTWERPGAWGLVALAIPIVILHMRFRRRRDAAVPSLALWRELAPEGTGRRGLRRVEDALQLVCLLAALVAFTAAVAGPVTGAGPAPSQRLAIVLDGSATMNARDGDRTRFDAARDAAAQAIGRLGPGDDVVVWLATDAPRVVVEPTRDLEAARTALAALRATLAPRSVAAASDAAASALPPGGRLLVLTDAAGAADVRTPRAVVGATGTSDVANAAIDRIDWSAADGTLAVRVRWTDGAPSARTLVATRDGREIARSAIDATVALQARVAQASVAVAGDVSGVVRVRLEPSDDFAPDDAAELVLPQRGALRVVLAAPRNEPSPFLVEALRAAPDLVDAARAVLAGRDAPAAALADADVVVAEDEFPAAAPADRPRILFGARGRSVATPILWSVRAHALTDGADLSPLRIATADVLDLGDGEVAVVECAEGPVVVAGETHGVRHVRIGFRPDATTLPLEAAFPVLVRNALRWTTRREGLPPSVVAGGPVVVAGGFDLPPEVWIEGPSGVPPRRVRVAGGVLAELAPLPSPETGRAAPADVRRMRARGLPGPSETAVNWFPPAEFRVGGREDAPAAPDVVAAVALAQPDRRANVDTREPWASACAVAGAAALAAGAVALGAGRVRGAPNVDRVPGRG